MSTLRVDNIKSRTGTAVTIPSGQSLDVTGDVNDTGGSKNATLQAHLHSNSYLSGNYFVNFDRNIHTLLNFYNDRLMNGFY